MKQLLILFLLVITNFNLFAQTMIQGSVSDPNYKPITGSSIFVKDSYIGSISNRDGKFSIRIPQKLQSGTLCISSIGYQTQEISIKTIQSPLQIQLQQDTCDLAEVLVMPKDTLLALLRRAYGKIKDNYPDFDTRMKGLYRETYFIPKKKEYLYFGEAKLDIFKTSYKNKTEGQVKTINSRMNKHPMYDSLSTAMWYGGIHFPLYSDQVKTRSDFISPGGFKTYNYSIFKTNLDGRSVYKVEFRPKDSAKERFKGSFYLDKNSLAYLYFEYTYTEHGKKKRSNYLSRSMLRNQSRKHTVKYRKVGNAYFLCYASDFEILYNNRSKQEMIQYNEYITTNIHIKNVKPIPFSEQTEYRDVFYLDASSIEESNWKEENIILPDSSLNKLIQYSSEEAKQLLNKQHTLPKQYKFKQKLIEIITKIYFDIDFETRMTSEIANASILYSPTSNHKFSKNFDLEEKQNYSYGMKMGYKLNPYFDINYYTKESLGKNLSKQESLGFAYETPIINRGNQLFVMCGINYFFSQDAYHAGDCKSSHTFKAGGKKIRADKIALYAGKKKQGVSFDLGLKTKLSGLYSMFVMAGYQLNTLERDRLFIKEKSGFFLTRKTTDISLKDSSVRYFENGVQTTKTNFDADDFYLKAGIRFAF
jgi:hypothetical protein